MWIKKIIRGGINYISDKNYRFQFNVGLGKYDNLPDDVFLKKYYQSVFGRELDIENPQTFTEKLQWLKLYDRRPEYTMMVDKYLVREHISKTIGSEYLIPLLGVWNTPDEINFNMLPNQFVLKCNHNSGLGMCICKNKKTLNISKVKRDLWKGIKENYYLKCREWPYKNVPRKIIAESYLEDELGEELKDYKIYCFNGQPKYCQVIANRFTNETIDFYDLEWNHQLFVGLTPKVKNSYISFSKPKNFQSMIKFSSILSESMIFSRIDFYESKGKLFFGEITLYPMSGFGQFYPDEWNYKLGEMIHLPND